jgi:hypothetical protein
MQKLLTRRGYLITQIKELQDRLAELDLTISLLRGEAEPGPTPSTAPEKPPPAGRRKNVKRTVMDLVNKTGDLGVTASEIIDRARELGHDFDRGSVSSLLSKFKAAGALRFDGERYYPIGKGPATDPPSLRVIRPAV